MTTDLHALGLEQVYICAVTGTDADRAVKRYNAGGTVDPAFLFLRGAVFGAGIGHGVSTILMLANGNLAVFGSFYWWNPGDTPGDPALAPHQCDIVTVDPTGAVVAEHAKDGVNDFSFALPVASSDGPYSLVCALGTKLWLFDPNLTMVFSKGVDVPDGHVMLGPARCGTMLYVAVAPDGADGVATIHAYDDDTLSIYGGRFPVDVPGDGAGDTSPPFYWSAQNCLAPLIDYDPYAPYQPPAPVAVVGQRGVSTVDDDANVRSLDVSQAIRVWAGSRRGGTAARDGTIYFIAMSSAGTVNIWDAARVSKDGVVDTAYSFTRKAPAAGGTGISLSGAAQIVARGDCLMVRLDTADGGIRYALYDHDGAPVPGFGITVPSGPSMLAMLPEPPPPDPPPVTLLRFTPQYEVTAPAVSCDGPLLEVWPPPDQAYPLRVRAYAADRPFGYTVAPSTEPDDTVLTQCDARLVFLFALAKAKAHYGHQDANVYADQFNVMLGRLRAGAHGTRRYVPHDEPHDELRREDADPYAHWIKP